MASQTIGAILGCLVVFMLSEVDDVRHMIHPPIAMLCPSVKLRKELDTTLLCDGTHRHVQNLFAEIIFTFVYIAVVLSAIYYKGADKMASAMVVIFVLFMVISGAASISGGSINPAVGIAQLLF